ncbi:hypothetical protein MBRU_01260 [Mycolicibacterium brumae DSM 44177]|nr:hypothetical protein MBRU_01260 [Mycolicibacterium brumae DSM 44177]
MGVSKPAIIRSSVVLPQPEDPSREKNSPGPTWKSAPLTAVNSPNRLVTRSISTVGWAGSPGAPVGDAATAAVLRKLASSGPS